MAGTTTITGALALLGEHAEPSAERVDIVIEGAAIAEVRASGRHTPVGEVIDASDCLVVPGMVNGHHHSHEHFHKGRYDSLPLELWMNFVRPLKPVPVTAEQVYLRTLVGAIEAVRSGTTTIVDDLNVTPELDPALVEAALRAYEDIGIRAYVGVTLFDRPFFRGVPFVDEEFPPDLLEELDGRANVPANDLLEFARWLGKERHPRDHRVGALMAPSAPQRCSEGFLRRVRYLADELDLPTIIHVQETRLQVVTGYQMFGSTMIEYLDRIGFLKPRTSIVHGVWVTPGELEILARTGVTVQHNPCSNFKLGSGLMPMRAMLDAGVNVALGSDGCGSIDSVDMLRVLSNTALVQKLRGEDHTRWIGAAEAWRAATQGGAKGLGRGDLGIIAPGMTADLAIYRLSDIGFAPLNQPLTQLVYAQSGRALDTVLVDGQVIMRAGRLTGINEADTIAAIRSAHEALAPEIALAEDTVNRLRAAYERIYWRCQALPIPSDTLPARFP